MPSPSVLVMLKIRKKTLAMMDLVVIMHWIQGRFASMAATAGPAQVQKMRASIPLFGVCLSQWLSIPYMHDSVVQQYATP